MKLLKLHLLLITAIALTACKIQITVPQGGKVKTESGSFTCLANQTCTIDVVDIFFDEIFVAEAEPGYTFDRWKEGHGYFCGGRRGPCHLATTGFANNDSLLGFLRRDDIFHLAPEFSSTPQAIEATLSPEGGVLEFPNGVVLDIPKGAVTQPTQITLSLLPKSPVDAIFDSRKETSSAKRFLGGFSVTPDVQFNVPIKAKVPIETMRPYELPVQTEVESDQQRYWYTRTNLHYSAREQAVEIEVSNFSAIAVAAIDGIDPERLDELCTDPAFNSVLKICEDFDDLQPAYCLLGPEDRPPDAVCCRELSFTSESDATDFSSNRASGECEAVSDSLRMTYHECTRPDGTVAPSETSEMCDVSPNCTKEQQEKMRFRLEIEQPDSACFAKGERLTLTTVLSDSQGQPQPHGTVTWKSLDTGVASVSSTGLVTARAQGRARIEASYRLGCQSYTDTVELEVIDLNGTWTATEVADEQACGEGVNSYTSTVTVRQSGQTVSIFAAGGSGNGTKHGCSISGYSFEWEDEGITRGNGSARIASGGNLMEGSGSWTWSGDGFSCSGSSTMKFRR